MSHKTIILFIALAALFCLSTFYEPYPFDWLVKILPMFILISIVSLQVFITSTLPQVANNQSPTPYAKRMTMLLIALLFSSCGDVLLAMGQEHFFTFGLGAFLIGHLFFIMSFRPINQPLFNIVNKNKFVYVVTYILAGLIFFSLMAGNLGELFIPVFVYMLVLLSMAITSVLSKNSNNWLVLGGVSFLISDSLIGINKFYTPVPFAHLWIMITYYFAQFALVTGLLNTAQIKK